MIKCKKCGYQLDDNSKFCINCGLKVVKIQENDIKKNDNVYEIPKLDYPPIKGVEQQKENDFFNTDKIEEGKSERRKRWLEEQKKTRSELKFLDKKEESLQELKDKIDIWKNEGFVVSELEDVIYKKELPELIKIFADFEEDVQILKEIKVKLERLDTTGFEEIVEFIISNLDDPESKSTILEQVMMLEEKIKQSKTKKDEYFKRIENWKNEGLIIDTLEELLESNSTEIESAIIDFENKVKILYELKNNISEMEAKGFDVKEIKIQLNDISKIEFIKEKITEMQKEEKDMGPWYLIGRDLYELGNYGEAIKYFDKALEKDPNNEMIQKIRNICYEKSGYFQTEIGTEKNEKQKRIEELYSRGVDQGSLGNYDEAIKYFDQVIELEPTHEKAWFNKGWALEDLSRFEEALDCYDTFIGMDPNNSEAWTIKAYVLQRLGKNDDALSSFDNALLIEPENAEIHGNKGILLGKLGRFYEAYISIEKATELNQFNADLWNKKAMVLYKLKRFDEAIESCNKALEIDPENKSAKKGKSMCLKKQNKSRI